MNQIIDIPTRVTADTTSLIDLFFVVSNLNSVITYGTLPKIADHDGILCSFNVKIPQGVKEQKLYMIIKTLILKD